jgi:hypothetical protein
MIDFNIRRGPSTILFSKPGVVNDNVVIEEGCWYLCTDTAELYLGVLADDKLTLKKINGHNAADVPTTGGGDSEPERGLIGAYINDDGELCVIFSDDTEESLGVVVGQNGIDGKDGLDGLTTSIKIGDNTYEHVDGIIELPSFITNDQLTDNYYTKDQVDGLIPEVPTKVSRFQNDVGYLTKHQDISHLADKVHTHSIADITDYVEPSFDGYATEEFVNKKIAEAELSDKEADLEAYYTKSEVDALIPDVSGFIKEVPNEYVTESELDAKGYLTAHQSLEDYAKLSDLPSVDGLASELYVDEKVAAIELTPGKDGVTPHIGANGNWFIGEEDTGVKAHGIDGINGKDGQDGAPGEKGDTGAQGPKGDAFTYEDFTKEQLEALRGEQGPAGKDGENGKDGKDFTFDMFTPEQLESLKVKGDPGQDGKDGIDGKDFTFDMFTEEQLSLLKGETGAQGERGADGKDGLTTAIKVGKTTYTHENGLITLPEFATVVPFTTAKFITNPIGNFVAGDDVNGMTIAEILAKLLGLSDENPTMPDVPTVPETKEEIIAKILETNAPSYVLAESGELVAVEYSERSFDSVEEAKATYSEESFFYTVTDEANNVVYAGYQISTPYQ